MAYDVVIIGGGHNGLVAAGYLAKSGIIVLLLENLAEDYAYEVSVLGSLFKHNIEIINIPMESIYKNENSKIRPIQTSIRILVFMLKMGRKF